MSTVHISLIIWFPRYLTSHHYYPLIFIKRQGISNRRYLTLPKYFRERKDFSVACVTTSTVFLWRCLSRWLGCSGYLNMSRGPMGSVAKHSYNSLLRNGFDRGSWCVFMTRTETGGACVARRSCRLTDGLRYIFWSVNSELSSMDGFIAVWSSGFDNVYFRILKIDITSK